MFTVRCGITSLWHPAVHHSLLLLRALKQRHTLVLGPSNVGNSSSDKFWHVSNCGGHLSVATPSSDSSTISHEKDVGEVMKPLLGLPRSSLQSVHDPQHILFFFFTSDLSKLTSQSHKQLEAYLDAVIVTNQVLRATDDLLIALNIGEMEAIRQAHGYLIDLVSRLDLTLQNDDDVTVQWLDRWSTWPIFSTLQFLVEEGGLLQGPFPRLTKAYLDLRGSKPVVAHTRLISRTVQLVMSGDEASSQLGEWIHRGFLRKIQQQLSEYTASTAVRLTEGVTSEKGPLRVRVSGARFGLQPISAHTPWTMQGERMSRRVAKLMSRNGELCLKKIIVSYCPSKGSPNTRQFLATHLPRFHVKYPSVKIDIRPRLWAETSITGVYRDGSERSYNTMNMSSMGIWLRFHRLVNTANDYDQPFAASHLHFQRRSIQGTWNPWLWHYETERSRTEPSRWQRKLSEKEWDYYIGQYSAQMKQEEEAIQKRVAEHTDIPEQSTKEVQERWKKHVMPRLQTDMEFNLTHFKRQHAKEKLPEPVSMREYRLFSVPDHSELGQDAVDMMRRREAKHLEEWWRRRKEQLKPPT